MVAEYTYDAWGNPDIKVDVDGIGSLNPIRYRGYYYDTETNLYYLRTRYYDSEIGRFVNADGISILDESKDMINGLNLYAYCGNNPVMNIDPNGNAWWNPATWNWKKIGKVALAVTTVVAIAGSVALTAGIAATGIAIAAGATIATTSAILSTVTATAMLTGTVIGGLEIVKQAKLKGVENMNFGSIALSTFSGAVSGGFSAGMAFAGPLGVGILAGAKSIFAGLTSFAYSLNEGKDIKLATILRAQFFSVASVIIVGAPHPELVMAVSMVTGEVAQMIKTLYAIIFGRKK